MYVIYTTVKYTDRCIPLGRSQQLAGRPRCIRQPAYILVQKLCQM